LNKLPFEYQQALIAAKEASEIIIDFYEQGFTTEIKSDGSPVTQADLASSLKIQEHLIKTNIPVLGEESIHPEFEIRKNWTKNWCVDPLDGTKEFIKKNGEFSVCIALIENNTPTFGVIAWPIKKKILVGGEGFGVFIVDFEDIDQNNKWEKLETKSSKNNPLVVLGSRSFHSHSEDYIENLKKNHTEVVFKEKGSALKFFDLASGTADIYPRFAPTMEWDIAAGQAILNELGGEVLNVETGKPLTYNKENLLNPFFIAKTKPMI